MVHTCAGLSLRFPSAKSLPLPCSRKILQSVDGNFLVGIAAPSLVVRSAGGITACNRRTISVAASIQDAGSEVEEAEKLRVQNQQLLARLSSLESALAAAAAKLESQGESSENKTIAETLRQALSQEYGAHMALPAAAAAAAAAGLGTAIPSILPSCPSSLVKSVAWPSPYEKPPFWTRSSRFSLPSPAAPTTFRDVQRDNDTCHVCHVTAEMAPLAKVGGLGDVVTGLGRACLARGHNVHVILPFYECMDTSQIEELSQQRSFGSYFKGDWIGVEAHTGKVEGIPVILLKPDNHFFRGGRIYGGSYNELEAYLFFSRAALEYLQVTNTQPDIIHVHEWHTAAVALLFWDMYHEMGLQRPRLVLTIHNMEHHGECRYEQLDMIGLNGQSYVTVEKAMDERTIGHNPERLSLLKGGIVYSNIVTTVSPTYSQETLCSGWLSNTLLKYTSKYVGVLNGIDTDIWDPMTDPLIPANYSASDLRGKALCKRYVQLGLGLEAIEVVDVQEEEEEEEEVVEGEHPEEEEKELEASAEAEVTEKKEKEVEAKEEEDVQKDSPVVVATGPSGPLVVCVTRLVAQKGIHLIRHAIFRTQELGGQFVLLGSSPDGRIQGEFEALANDFEKSPNVRLLLTYSETLSHLLFAAADITLVPSMFEPCGLTQMIGMRYGAIPVVRRTGGLADTVFDVDDPKHKDTANGFVFDGINEDSLNGALDRAIRYYQQKPDWWVQLTCSAMEIDNSWNKAAGEYVKLYNSVRVR